MLAVHRTIPEQTMLRPRQEAKFVQEFEGRRSRTISFSIHLYDGGVDGKRLANWSLAPFQKPGDTSKDPDLADRLRRVASSLGVRSFYAPVPTEFNGRIVTPEELPVSIDLGGVFLHRGAHADGVVLPRGNAFLLSAAGCPIIVATDGETTVVAHAGLKSHLRWDGTEHTGVAYSMARYFPNLKRAKAWVFFSIRPDRYEHSFTNERYKAESRRIQKALADIGCSKAMNEQGNIDLPTLVRHQLAAAGFTNQSRTKDCYLVSNAYDTRMPPPRNLCRNAIVVKVGGIQ